WDGRKDSLWSQALGPLESAVEHGGNRTLYAHLIARYYRDEYEALFGPMPDLSGYPQNAGPVENPEWRAAWESMTAAQREPISRILANTGESLAAYERQLQFGASRFDQYVECLVDGETERAATLLTPDEVAGLRIFAGKGNCS